MGDSKDWMLMTCIRQANLDAFWSSRPTTVAKTRQGFKYHVKTSRELGFVAFPHAKPWPDDHRYGLEYAVSMLWKSLDPGIHEETVKFNVIRSLRSMATNVETMLNSHHRGRSIIRKGRIVEVESRLPSDSEFLKRFMKGLKMRRGEVRRQDLAFTPEIVSGVLGICEEEWTACRNQRDTIGARKAAETACYFILTYAGGLRGFEVPKVVIRNLRNQFEDGTAEGLVPFVGVPLVGYFKQRDGIMSNLVIFLVQKTSSGIEIGKWLLRLLDVLEEKGITTGWLFQDGMGRAVHTSDFADDFYAKLVALKDLSPELFPPSVDVLEDYGPIRSGRRGADVQALKHVKNTHHIEMFFRWNTGGDETSSLPMHILYADKKRMLKQFLLVSEVM